MIALSCAMLAAPLMVIAGAVSSPAGPFAALLAPFQRRGSAGLHARQILVPEECFPTCDPVISTVDGCSSAACQCTTQNMNGLFTCIECTVAVTQSHANLVNGQNSLINFGGNCAEKGFSLSVPTVTQVAAGSTPSLASVNSPTQTTPNQNPPTAIPVSFGAPSASAFVSGSNNGSGPTSARATATPQQSQGGGAAGRVPSNAIRVGDRVEITSLLFNLCVLVVLVS